MLQGVAVAYDAHGSRGAGLYADYAGFEHFGRTSRGFLTNEACVIGIETRTSAPVRIVRDRDTLQHVAVDGLFPCGEGAGYAGGIVSAAIDGERCAEAAAAYVRKIS